MDNPTPRPSRFELTPDQQARFTAWKEEQDAETVRLQNAAPAHPDPLGITDEPYYGATGGAYTFKFTPTGVGTVVKVEGPRGVVLDLSDYESW